MMSLPSTGLRLRTLMKSLRAYKVDLARIYDSWSALADAACWVPPSFLFIVDDCRNPLSFRTRSLFSKNLLIAEKSNLYMSSSVRKSMTSKASFVLPFGASFHCVFMYLMKSAAKATRSRRNLEFFALILLSYLRKYYCI